MAFMDTLLKKKLKTVGAGRANECAAKLTQHAVRYVDMTISIDAILFTKQKTPYGSMTLTHLLSPLVQSTYTSRNYPRRHTAMDAHVSQI